MPQPFNDSIGRRRDNGEIAARREYRLVMKRVHLQSVPIQKPPERVISVGERHFVPEFIPSLAELMLTMGQRGGDRIRQMLDQGAALGNVHDLEPTTNAERRQVVLHGVPPSRDLESVALGVNPVGLWMNRRIAETGGIDVPSATQDHSIHMFQQG